MHITYCHTCKHNGKCYVGFTPITYHTLEKPLDEMVKNEIDAEARRLMLVRWQSHVYASRENSLLTFHKAIRKHGEDAFEHRVLEVFEDRDDALRGEQHWIKELKSTTSEHGYNDTLGGDVFILTSEAKERLRKHTKEAMWRPDVRERLLAAQRSPETRAKKRLAAVRRWSKMTVLEQKQYSDSMKAAQSVKDVRERKIASLRETLNRPEYRAKRHKCRCLVVQQLTLGGVVIATFSSVKNAALATHISGQAIGRCARGITNSYAGFLWRYVNE